jgi:peptidoglycan hydrolase-like protein with peptidoglycan-binding domain
VAFDEAAHPRGEAGSAEGGKFVAGSSSSKAPAKSKKAALQRGGRGGGTLSYNGKTGTGYGKAGGDPRVRKLQEALNRLGLKDSKGRPLKVDGKLGPLTTAAVMRAQKQAGVPPTGKVTPALLKQLTSAKGKPKPASGTHKRTALARKKRPLKTPAGSKKPTGKAKPKPPRPKPPPAVQRAIARIPADQRK